MFRVPFYRFCKMLTLAHFHILPTKLWNVKQASLHLDNENNYYCMFYFASSLTFVGCLVICPGFVSQHFLSNWTYLLKITKVGKLIWKYETMLQWTCYKPSLCFMYCFFLKLGTLLTNQKDLWYKYKQTVSGLTFQS